MEKETLEGVAKEMYKGEYICNGIDLIPVWREGFILGAKWQQERMYSEEEVIQMLMYGIHEARMQDDKLEYQILNETLEQYKKK